MRRRRLGAKIDAQRLENVSLKRNVANLPYDRVAHIVQEDKLRILFAISESSLHTLMAEILASATPSTNLEHKSPVHVHTNKDTCPCGGAVQYIHIGGVRDVDTMSCTRCDAVYTPDMVPHFEHREILDANIKVHKKISDIVDMMPDGHVINQSNVMNLVENHAQFSNRHIVAAILVDKYQQEEKRKSQSHAEPHRTYGHSCSECGECFFSDIMRRHHKCIHSFNVFIPSD